MTSTVFWSWQSDRPSRVTRALIRDALNAALDRIAVDLDEAERPELDHDTRGVPGSPDIVATVLSKIDAAAVFVADVTPIAVSDGGKHVANPNVLIELGYAKRALGTERVILVWNTAFTNTRPEDLPFDMRGRRAPFSYSLAVDASRDELRRARDDLSRSLEAAVRASLGVIPPPPLPAPNWHPAADGEPSIWRDGSAPLVVNRGALDGSAELSIGGAPRGYARLIPSRWSAAPNAISILENRATLTPLGRSTSINWGSTRGGFLAYRSSNQIEAEGETPSATRWFRDTGEMWGVSSSFFVERDGDYVLSTGYAAQQWVAWLTHTASVLQVLGGAPPFEVELGLDQFGGAWWPPTAWGRERTFSALEERIVHHGLLVDEGEAAAVELVRRAFVHVTMAFGLPPLSNDQFDAMLKG